MNPIFTNDEQRLDRLVDGELSEAERRELLQACEHQPDGWRRCALAFLEAQEWRGALGSLARPEVPPPAATETRAQSAAKSAASRWPLTRFGTLLAMAACFLIAAAITLELKDRFGDTGALPGNGMIAQTEQKLPKPIETPEARPEANGPWQMVTLSVPEDATGAAANIRLPCREGDKRDVDWLQNLPTSLAPDVRQALERSGYQVRQVRQLVPVPLGDGRRLVVPVDQVEVRYVGDKTY